MFKLIQWTAIGAVVVAAGGYLLFGSNVGSYIGTAASSIRQGISDSIPVEFELKRARNLIHEIDPQLHDAKRDLAQAEVDLERVQQEVDRLQGDVDKGEKKLRNVSSALSRNDGQTTIALAGWDRRRVEIDLQRTFENHKNNLALLEGKRALIERQTRAVAAARDHLDAVRAEKSRLEDMVAALTTQKRQLDALAASSRSFDLDDTALGRAREVLDEVKNRLDVAQRMMEDEVFVDPPDAQPHGDIAKEVQQWFQQNDHSAPAAPAAAAMVEVH